MKTLAIIGGTGRVGQFVVKEALARGYKLRVLVRGLEPVINHENLTVIPGDATDAKALEQLVTGADAVVSTLGPAGINKSLKLAKQNAANNLSSTSTKQLIPLLKKHNIKRFVLMGGASLKHRDDRNNLFIHFMLTKVAPLILGNMTHDRQLELSLLQQSDVNFTFVRAPGLEDKVATSAVKSSATTFQGGKVSVPRLAEFLLDQVDANNYSRKAVYVANTI